MATKAGDSKSWNKVRRERYYTVGLKPPTDRQEKRQRRAVSVLLGEVNDLLGDVSLSQLESRCGGMAGDD
ncbi:hypothetical protein KCP77_07225 [Salmonella enterica subsp. enterica]|nr:hypothetical protein KCP77_07225 [Salmonella enterica subsp. enterica]